MSRAKPDDGHDWKSNHTRDGTFNVCANCNQTYGKHDKQCAMRAPIRETAIEATPAPAVVVRRAERIEIDTCDQCPWYRKKSNACTSDGHGTAAPRFMEDDDGDPPEWCPITGMVIMIGGPKNA